MSFLILMVEEGEDAGLRRITQETGVTMAHLWLRHARFYETVPA